MKQFPQVDTKLKQAKAKDLNAYEEFKKLYERNYATPKRKEIEKEKAEERENSKIVDEFAQEVLEEEKEGNNLSSPRIQRPIESSLGGRETENETPKLIIGSEFVYSKEGKWKVSSGKGQVSDASVVVQEFMAEEASIEEKKSARKDSPRSRLSISGVSSIDLNDMLTESFYKNRPAGITNE